MYIIYLLLLPVITGCMILTFSPPVLAQSADSAFDQLDREVRKTPLKENMDIRHLRQRQQEMKKDLHEKMAVQEAVWGVLGREMEAQWDAMVTRVHAQREMLRQRVEQQWNEFQDSTNKQWVDYSPGFDTRSRVDFEKGEMEFSVLVPVEDIKEDKKPVREKSAGSVQKENAGPEISTVTRVEQDRAREIAEEKIKKQIKKVLSAENEVKTEVLKDQIRDPEGNKVTPDNAEQYVEKYVAPEIKVEKKPVVAGDGIPRVKVKVKIKMVPEHLRIRAARYKDQVDLYAEKYHVETALIYALIHTESYFNPLAKSYVPAFGLMQLVPKSGAMDAYYYIHKEKKLLPADYLYEPDNNVLLGATYYHILNSIYLDEVNDGASRESLSIAAYNWGPGNIKNKIVNKNNVNALTDEEVVNLINAQAPKETRDYIRKVKKRKALYEGM